jgi:hypothetical protein
MQDTEILASQTLGEDYGVKELSEAAPLPAPDYQVTKVSSPSGKLLAGLGTNSHMVSLAKNNSRFGSLEGLVLNHEQAVNLQVTLPKASGANGAANIVGGGLFAKLDIEEDKQPLAAGVRTASESEGEAKPIPIVSEVKSIYAEKEVESSEYAFSSMYDCKFPIKPGTNCNLRVKLLGHNDGKKHIGHLVVADLSSYSRYIPVFINYNILKSSNIINVDAGDSSIQELTLKNVSGRRYKSFKVEGLPAGSSIEAGSSCNNGAEPGEECKLGFNLGNAEAGKYIVKVYGITAGNEAKPLSEIAEMDSEAVEISVNSVFMPGSKQVAKK